MLRNKLLAWWPCPKYSGVYFLRTRIFSTNTTIRWSQSALFYHPVVLVIVHCNAKGSCVPLSCHISLVSFSLELGPRLPSSFRTLACLKITGQQFCRMTFSLDLTDAHSWLDLGCGFWGATTQRWFCVLFIAPCRFHTNDVHCERLIKVMSTRLFLG